LVKAPLTLSLSPRGEGKELGEEFGIRRDRTFY